MVLDEERECAVCFLAYTRQGRTPRILHCQHTFCATCLEVMTKLQDGLHTVSCPLCRWITCTLTSSTLPGAMWVNTEIWDQITEGEKEMATEEETLKEWLKNPTQMQPALVNCVASSHSGFKSQLQRILRNLRCLAQGEDQGC